MGEQEKKGTKSSSGKVKFIAIGVGIAVVIAISIGVALSSRGGTPQSPNPEISSANSRTVSWIHVHGLGT